MAALAEAAILASSVGLAADIPDDSFGRFGGIYKVTSSTDPAIPATTTSEYFLDFGRGIQPDKISGSVAISVRQNPHVKVRIFAWQYFPDQGKIVIGNPFAEGSRRAVAIGAWRIKGMADGVIFEREHYQVVLHRAAPDDY